MKEEIRRKQDRLNYIRVSLKSKFFGIDKQIDSIIDSITAWYSCPDIITRPTIVNLWGLTGVGKTSVVRELVSLLGMSDKYLELQLCGSETETIAKVLEDSNIDSGESGVILLDEFQRFRTVDNLGTEIKTTSKMSDIWMLLSDGKFSFENIYKRLYRIVDMIEWPLDGFNYRTKKYKRGELESAPERPRTLTANYYKDDLKLLIKVLKLDTTVEELCELYNDEISKMIKDFIRDNPNSCIDYTKCLIFISGNLDEAFKIADAVDNCDTDADIYHEYTSNLSLTSIKKALKYRFKPEQIARLGNDHIIYPSLNKETYNKIIKYNCDSYLKEMNKLSPIEVVIKSDVYESIYENSVFPTQGTRPVFSTIQKIFTSPLSRGLLWAIENDFRSIQMCICKNPSVVRFESGFHHYDVSISLDIEESRKKYSEDYTALIAVHEAGHAIVYADLFQEAPKEIKINAAAYKGGYNILDNKASNKESILNKITCVFAGLVAEEMIFGQNNRSSGCASDIETATMLASSYIRSLAMNGNVGKIQKTQFANFIEGMDESDKHIENLLQEQRKEAVDILNKRRQVLIDLSKVLFTDKKMSKNEFETQFGNHFKFKTHADDVHGNYFEIFKTL